jgi:hypothetical protein
MQNVLFTALFTTKRTLRTNCRNIRSRVIGTKRFQFHPVGLKALRFVKACTRAMQIFMNSNLDIQFPYEIKCTLNDYADIFTCNVCIHVVIKT